MQSLQDGAGDRHIFAIGDIHGCFTRLTALMARLPFDEERDRLVFLGDYINRGPDSRQVIDYLSDLRRRCPHCVFLLGNHEYALLSYAAGHLEMLQTLRKMGVEATLQSYGNASVHTLLDLSFLPPEHQAFLNSLELRFESGPYIFTHADIAEGHKPYNQSNELLFSRRLAEGGATPDGRIVIFGHTAFATPLVTPDRIGIDTGAVYGNVLTALQLPERRFFHA